MPQNDTFENRLERILFLLKKRGRMSTKDLSQIFRVSEVTIRNDLNELSKQGLVIRSYGGASIAGPMIDLGPASGSLSYTEDDRDNIGKIASVLVQEGDVIFLDTSRPAVALADFIKDMRHLTVFTNSIEIAYKLSAARGVNLYILGGRVGKDSAAVEAADVGDVIGEFHITKAFIGAWGLTPEHGLSDPWPDEVDMKRKVIARANESIVLIDSSRWGTDSLRSFATISDFQAIVTDSKAPANFIDFCKKSGVKCVQHREKGREGADRERPYEYFNMLKKDAQKGVAYPGRPGKGKKVAFANGLCSEPYCRDIQNSFVGHALLAGFDRENIYIFDNCYDEERAIENSREILALHPDIFVQFQINSKVNHIIAEMFQIADIPIIAVDVPVPSAPFIGINNWQAAVVAGEFAAEVMRRKYSALAEVDRIVLIQMTAGADMTLFRSEGFAAAIVSALGDVMEEKIVREDGETSAPEGAARAMERVLRDHPGAKNLVITTINDETMQAVIDVLQENGRWDPGRLVLVSHGVDEIGRRLIRQGLVDGSVAHFPESYGEYILPAVCSVLHKELVPPYMYIKNLVITKQNIDDYYPTA